MGWVNFRLKTIKLVITLSNDLCGRDHLLDWISILKKRKKKGNGFLSSYSEIKVFEKYALLQENLWCGPTYLSATRAGSDKSESRMIKFSSTLENLFRK